MKIISTLSAGRKAGERGNIVVWCLIMVTVVTVSSGVAMLVSQSSKVTLRRSQMISALQYAQGGAVIACNDLNNALSGGGSLTYNLQHASLPYTGTSNTLFQRTIAAPFSNQTVTAWIQLTGSSMSSSAKVIASATVGAVTQTATVNLKMSSGYPAAIISVNAGTTSTGNSKSDGQDGNVAINGSKSGPIIVDGAGGLAVLANGRVSYDTNYLNPPASAYSMTNWGSANEVPDYTSQGTTNALFDLPRFIAVADLTPGGPSPSGNNHFTNLASFMSAVKNHPNNNKPLEGVVVVDIFDNGKVSDPDMNNLTPSYLPNGINIKGTLLFNFIGSGWDPVSEKIKCLCDLNVNPADLSGLVAKTPATYPTGYPPSYSDSTKNPININITSKGFQNFAAGDDLPALIYSTGCLDMHGNVNVCGVLYTPCYIELENKQSGNTHYIKGCVICGHGIYYENNVASTSIISYDANTVDFLTTIGFAGKSVLVSYWEP